MITAMSSWWLVPYVAKALARGEILYAKHFLDEGLRTQLMSMLTWVFGIRTNFNRNPGKIGKHFQEILAPNNWSRLLETYSRADPYDTWKGLLEMCDLFREFVHEVADKYGFEYPHQDDSRVTKHLLEIHDLCIGDEI